VFDAVGGVEGAKTVEAIEMIYAASGVSLPDPTIGRC